jgi:hypothetical protein
MERNRYIHSLRETSYKIDIKNRISNDDLTVNVYGLKGELVSSYHFDARQLQGKNSIHFKFINGNVVWLGGVSPTGNKPIGKHTVSVLEDNKVVQKEDKKNRDEVYVIDLCDEVLGIKSSRQHRFPFLLGDSGIALPVDAYYEKLSLVIEYCERQHTEAVAFFDRKQTVSGVSRGEQRRLYDERRKAILPQHDIKLVNISYSDFEYDSQKRIIRNHQRDIEIVRKKLGL